MTNSPSSATNSWESLAREVHALIADLTVIETSRQLQSCVTCLLEDDTYATDRIRAGIALAEWIRWPWDREYANSRVLVMISALIEALRERKTLTADNLLLLTDIYNPYRSILLLSDSQNEYGPPVPYFDTEFYAKDIHDIADCVTLLCYGRRNTISLNRVFRALEDFTFANDDESDILSQRAHERSWSLYRASSAFLYINTVYFGDRWTLNPHSADFFDNLNTLLNDRQALDTYFGNVAWAQARMIEKMHGNARAAAHFLDLPRSVLPIEPEAPTFPPELDTLLRKKRI